MLSECSLNILWVLFECSLSALWPTKIKIDCSWQTCAGRTDTWTDAQTHKVTPWAPVGAKKGQLRRCLQISNFFYWRGFPKLMSTVSPLSLSPWPYPPGSGLAFSRTRRCLSGSRCCRRSAIVCRPSCLKTWVIENIQKLNHWCGGNWVKSLLTNFNASLDWTYWSKAIWL